MRRTWTAAANTEQPQRAAHVVVVEAGQRSTSALVSQLLGEDFTVSRVVDVAAAIHAARRDAPDVVLIDAHLGVAHAVELCRTLRRCADMPILVLAGNAETARRIDANDCGAEACLVEPYEPAELIARLRPLIERARRCAHSLHPPWQIDHGARSVAIGWCVLDLTPTEFRLLETFLLSNGKTHSREALLDCIQTERRDVCDRAIDIHVRSLRRKIAAVLPGRECIVSVYGVGYRFDR
jgi:two-component system, OmpR family, response regulator BaeR